MAPAVRPAMAIRAADASARTLILLTLTATTACGNDNTSDLPVWSPEDHSHPDDGTDGRAVPGREMSEEESVALLWVEACATCHGRSGRGDGPAAPAEAEMQDLTDREWQAATSDEEIAAVIVNGRERMPAYGPGAPRERRLNQLGIRALVRHIRRLRPQDSTPSGSDQGAPSRSAPAVDGSEAEPARTPTTGSVD